MTYLKCPCRAPSNRFQALPNLGSLSHHRIGDLLSQPGLLIGFHNAHQIFAEPVVCLLYHDLKVILRTQGRSSDSTCDLDAEFFYVALDFLRFPQIGTGNAGVRNQRLISNFEIIARGYFRRCGRSDLKMSAQKLPEPGKS